MSMWPNLRLPVRQGLGDEVQMHNKVSPGLVESSKQVRRSKKDMTLRGKQHNAAKRRRVHEHHQRVG